MTDHSKKIVVTGGTGKVGRACVKDLMAHGYQVLNVDSIAPREQLCPFIVADLADFGEDARCIVLGGCLRQARIERL